MKYRIYSSRFDITEHIYSEFEAENDKEAITKFHTEEKHPSNSWDRMRMVCVTQIEQTRPVTHNARMQKALDSDD